MYIDADIQTCLDESAARPVILADDRVRREPASAGRPELDVSCLQHANSPPEYLSRERPLPLLQVKVAPADR